MDHTYIKQAPLPKFKNYASSGTFGDTNHYHGEKGEERVPQTKKALQQTVKKVFVGSRWKAEEETCLLEYISCNGTTSTNNTSYSNEFWRKCAAYINEKLNVSRSESLSCSSCRDVQDIANCTGTIVCHGPEICYHSSMVNAGDTKVHTLGCTDPQTCASQSSSSTLFGRDLKRSPSECRECCSTDMCNAVLCPSTTEDIIKAMQSDITELVNRDKSNQLRIKALETEISELKQNSSADNSQIQSIIHDNEQNKADIITIKHRLDTGHAMDIALNQQISSISSNQATTHGFSSRIHHLETQTLWLSNQQPKHTTRMNEFNSTILSFNSQLKNIDLSIQRLHTRSAFSVSSPMGMTSSLLFTSINTNTGEFVTQTGIFHCSQAGIYLFTTSFFKKHTYVPVGRAGQIDIGCILYQNTRAISVIQVIPSALTYGDSEPAFGNTAVVHLRRGDNVYLGHCTNPNYLDYSSTFSGVLITPDM